MKKIFKNKNFILVTMMFILFFISNFYLINTILKINNIENTFRYLVALGLFLLFTLFLIKFLKTIINKRKNKAIILSIFLLFFFIVECFLYNTINKVYISIDSISNSNNKYSSSLITLKDNKITKMNMLINKKIGLFNEKSSIDGYVIPNEIINEEKLRENNKIIEYDNMVVMIQAMYDKEIDALFLNSNYATLFSSNGFENIKEETLVLKTKTKTIKETQNNETSMDKPFSILLMGVDSTKESIKSGSAFNGDALLLVTFNPKTLNATILSIPRDTYVPITCFKNNRENKITHAAWYGQDCMMKTIENFTKIKIDYYAKINFKGLVKLVDTLGGISIDVPYSFCEQNSSRLWGKNTVFVEKGYQKLNGEQALALSRNRHYPDDSSSTGRAMAKYCPNDKEGNRNDFTRGDNQQKVISAIMNELKTIKNLEGLNSLLDLMSDSIETNVSTNQIFSLYNIGKELFINNSSSTISFDSLYLQGRGQMIWDIAFKRPLYNYYYNRDSLKDIVKAMNINLEKEQPVISKESTFSINKIYEKLVIGKGPYSKTYSVDIVPKFIGQKFSVAKAWGLKNNVDVIIKEVEVDKENENNIVIKQSIPYAHIVEDINTDLTIEVGKYIPKTLEVDLSKVPDFSSYTLKMTEDWKNKVKDKLTVTIDLIKKDNAIYDETKKETLYKQSISPGISIDNIKELTIIFYE